MNVNFIGREPVTTGLVLIDPRDYDDYYPSYDTCYYGCQCERCNEWFHCRGGDDDLAHYTWDWTELYWQGSVKQVNIHKLNYLPQRESFWEVDGQSWRKWVKRNYIRDRMYDKAYRILHRRVGKPCDEIMTELYQKLQPARYRNEVIPNLIDEIRWNKETQQYHRINRYWDGKYAEVYVEGETSRWKNEFIQGLDGSLIRLRRINPRKQPKTNQEHYYALYQRRLNNKLWKQARRTAGLVEIRLLNHPGLYTFYLKVKMKYNSLVSSYHSAKTDWNRVKNNRPTTKIRNRVNSEYGNYSWKRYIYNEALKTIPQINELKQQLERIESGDYGSWWESSDYRYSVGKECHHFGTP